MQDDKQGSCNEQGFDPFQLLEDFTHHEFDQPELTNTPQSISPDSQQHSNEIIRAGAVSAEQAGNIDDNNLPMVVWLKGDEPYVQEFALDAEQAMQELGIKRSRLTQISGRELRVGRIRVERYIKPVYRQKDLTAYKAWTRATATHLKSTSMIKEAATQLEKQTEALIDEFQQAVTDLKSTIAGKFNEQTDIFTEQNHQIIAGIKHNSQKFNQDFANLTDNLTTLTKQSLADQSELHSNNFAQYLHHADERFDELHQTFHHLTKWEKHFDEIKQGLNQYENKLTELTSNMQALQTKQTQLVEDSLRDIGKAMALIIQLQKDAHKEILEQIRLLQSQPLTPTIKIVRNRKYRFPKVLPQRHGGER